MKRLSILIIVAILSGGAASAQLIDQPAATVNLTEPEFISVNQLNAQVRQIEELRNRGASGLPNDPMVILESMIQEVLLKQAAKSSGVTVTDAEVDAYINQLRAQAEAQQGGKLTDRQFKELVFSETGLSWEAYLEQIREQRQKIRFVRQEKQSYFDEMEQPSDEQIEKVFQRNSSNFINPEMVRISEIFVDTRNLNLSEKRKAKERAEQIYREYQNGNAEFGDLVLKYSDDTDSRYNEGDKGYFTVNDPRIQIYGEDFVDTIFSLEVGEVSKVIESNVGLHIVKVTDYRNRKFLELDDPVYPWEEMTVEEYIRNNIMQQREQQVFEQALSDLIGELRNRAEVEIFEENIKG